MAYKFYEDTSFVTGDSPVVYDVNTDLGEPGIKGYILNSGATNTLKFALSSDGATYGDNVTLGPGQQHNFGTGDWDRFKGRTVVKKIKLTWVADTSYRIFIEE